MLGGERRNFFEHLFLVLKGVDFIDAENCRKAKRLETLHKLPLRRGDFALGLRHEHGNIYVGDGVAHLFHHEVRKLGAGFMKTWGVDKHELGRVLGQNSGDAGSRCLGLCGNRRHFFADEGVKEGAFSHVRSSDYCHEG